LSVIIPHQRINMFANADRKTNITGQL
jgi:hypothetical protein